MAFAFRQSKAGTGGSPVSFSMTSTVLSGSLLVAATFWNSAAATMSVTDSTNGAFTAAGSPLTGAGALTAWRLQFFYFINTAASPGSTMTATCSAGGTSTGLAVHEYTGTSVALDAGPAYANFTGSTTVTSDPVTTNVAATLLFAGGVTSDTAGAAGAGFVKREGAGFGNNITEDDTDGGTAGSKTATFSVAAAGDNTIVGLIAFREGDIPSAGVPIAWIVA